MQDPVILAIDNGTQSVRALLFGTRKRRSANYKRQRHPGEGRDPWNACEVEHLMPQAR